MTQNKILDFVEKLSKDYIIYAPKKEGEDVLVKKIDKAKEIDWSGNIPLNPFKHLFFPAEEVLFDLKNKPKEYKEKYKLTAAFGMNILDLKALALLDQVFEKDSYYQKRRREILIAGFSRGIPSDFRKYKIFSINYEENILEHLNFDIFFEKQNNGRFKAFSGSEKGQIVLEKYGISDYEHIEFAGLIPEEGPDKKMLEFRNRVEKGIGKKVWQELDKKCLACGKCTIVCPTCFCFDLKDRIKSKGIEKERVWSSCFYPEFSKIAPNYKFLPNVKSRIYFWYYHHFVRTPDTYMIPGCVNCMRCFKTCPVGINIIEVLEKLK